MDNPNIKAKSKKLKKDKINISFIENNNSNKEHEPSPNCFYCHKMNNLIKPCSCKYVHQKCQIKFIKKTDRTNKYRCERCKESYMISVKMKDIMNLIV